MSSHSLERRRVRGLPMTLALTAMLAMILVAAPAIADHEAGAGDESTTHLENPALEGGNDTGGCANGEHEFKIEGDPGDVESGTYTDPATGTDFIITVYQTESGSAFDFEIDGGSTAEVHVKGGPDFNLYDYFVHEDHDGDDPVDGTLVSEDTRLHSPLHPRDEWAGLSHITFCYDEAVFVDAVLSGTKFLDGTTTGLEGWEIDILDEDENLLSTETTDENGEWSYTTEEFEQGTEVTLYVCEQQQDGWTQTSPDSSDTGTIAIDGYDGLCHEVTFTAGDTQEQIPGLDFANQPSGAIEIVKTAKHADDSGDTSPNLAATFTVEDSEGNEVGTIETDATTGVGCLDGLAPGTYSITETTVPDGYAAPTIGDAIVPNDAQVDCGDGDEVTVDVENTPLTDVSWSVDSQHDGGTSTKVTCYDEDGNVIDGYPVILGGDGDGSGSLPDLSPTDDDLSDDTDEVTVSCDFTVDP